MKKPLFCKIGLHIVTEHCEHVTKPLPDTGSIVEATISYKRCTLCGVIRDLIITIFYPPHYDKFEHFVYREVENEDRIFELYKEARDKVMRMYDVRRDMVLHAINMRYSR